MFLADDDDDAAPSKIFIDVLSATLPRERYLRRQRSYKAKLPRRIHPISSALVSWPVKRFIH